MKQFTAIITIAILAILVSASAFSASIGYLVVEEGVIKHHRGKVDKIYRQSEEKIQLNNRDEVQTGKRTKIKIFLLSKRDILHLYSNSYLKFNLVTKKRSLLSLPIGKIRCLVKNTLNKLTRRRRNFRLKTITATIGVKGTDFLVQTSGSSTNVLTLGGVVSLISQSDITKVIDLAAGMASRIRGSLPPAPAVEVPVATQQNILAADTGENWSEIDFQDGNADGQKEELVDPETRKTLEKIQREIDLLKGNLGIHEFLNKGKGKNVEVTIPVP
jgi:hypothetical protein